MEAEQTEEDEAADVVTTFHEAAEADKAEEIAMHLLLHPKRLSECCSLTRHCCSTIHNTSVDEYDARVTNE